MFSKLKIAKVETLRLKEFANLCWVKLTADDGTVGLGESFFGADRLPQIAWRLQRPRET